MAFTGRIGHLDGIESPWSNAGGMRSIAEVERLAQTGVGTIEVGSYTIPARLNVSASPSFTYDPVAGLSRNEVRMENKGFDEVEIEIPEMSKIAHAHNKKLIVNVAPVSDDEVSETQELVTRAYEAGADAVLVNAGCPYVEDEKGDKKVELSYRPRDLMLVLRGLKQVVGKYNPVFVRLSPYDNDGHKRLMASQTLWVPGTVSALYTPNTWEGESGPATAEKAAKETRLMVDYLRDTHVDVVRSGGIMNAKELKKSLDDDGAVSGSGTTFFYAPRNGWKEDVDELLSDLAA